MAQKKNIKSAGISIDERTLMLVKIFGTQQEYKKWKKNTKTHRKILTGSIGTKSSGKNRNLKSKRRVFNVLIVIIIYKPI
ncbi:hypothetical protein [Aquimarina sp. RZ0]|uniref:hypothetical protein n=1 Tax=Aquimarina sp. RZ0 TaxID=2607730 RepID=UPI0011F0DFC9|nr:hypothetical protein [Aquimarina sp. RZ0]KAA1243216.1 hypothetical protein F0000_22055 [Aquimarina sp. RZ0]